MDIMKLLITSMATKNLVIEVCDMKTNKCRKAKKANNFIDIGFNHILPTEKGAIIFGSCPGLGNTTFCWSKVTSKK